MLREQHQRLILWGEVISSSHIVAQFFWARYGLPERVCFVINGSKVWVSLPSNLVRSFGSNIGDFISLEIQKPHEGLKS